MSAVAMAARSATHQQKRVPIMKIENGRTLPTITGVMNGDTVDLSTVAKGSWSAFLFYRGHW